MAALPRENIALRLAAAAQRVLEPGRGELAALKHEVALLKHERASDKQAISALHRELMEKTQLVALLSSRLARVAEACLATHAEAPLPLQLASPQPPSPAARPYDLVVRAASAAAAGRHQLDMQPGAGAGAGAAEAARPSEAAAKGGPLAGAPHPRAALPAALAGSKRARLASGTGSGLGDAGGGSPGARRLRHAVSGGSSSSRQLLSEDGEDAGEVGCELGPPGAASVPPHSPGSSDQHGEVLPAAGGARLAAAADAMEEDKSQDEMDAALALASLLPPPLAPQPAAQQRHSAGSGRQRGSGQRGAPRSPLAPPALPGYPGGMQQVPRGGAGFAADPVLNAQLMALLSVQAQQAAVHQQQQQLAALHQQQQAAALQQQQQQQQQRQQAAASQDAKPVAPRRMAMTPPLPMAQPARGLSKLVPAAAAPIAGGPGGPGAGSSSGGEDSPAAASSRRRASQAAEPGAEVSWAPKPSPGSGGARKGKQSWFQTEIQDKISPAVQQSCIDEWAKAKSVPVVCADLAGTFFINEAGEYLVRLGGSGEVVSPNRFEEMAGKKTARNWQQSIRLVGHTMNGDPGAALLKLGHFTRIVGLSQPQQLQQ